MRRIATRDDDVFIRSINEDLHGQKPSAVFDRRPFYADVSEVIGIYTVSTVATVKT